MIIKPRIRGFICTTAHPVGRAASTNAQIAWTRNQPPLAGGRRNVLVIGGSGGYGLASRVVAAFAIGPRPLCLSFEKEPTPIAPAQPAGTTTWHSVSSSPMTSTRDR
jgi:enoyl-[acyl-carrier protein] reductase/trans-2-enoyl-CoA reductase (NAD+)